MLRLVVAWKLTDISEALAASIIIIILLLLLLLLTAIGFLPGGSVQYTSTKNINTI
jgi:hypothetical protein